MEDQFANSWKASTPFRTHWDQEPMAIPSPVLRTPSPPAGERDGVRGRGSWRARTGPAGPVLSWFQKTVVASDRLPAFYLDRPMDLTRTAYGTWSGGRYMHFGEPLSEERFLKVIQHAYRQGIRTFMSADVYGNGAADEMLGRALAGLPRDSYCLVGAVGHDFYSGKRDGSKGYPRFTHSQLRPPNQFADYLRAATEKSLARCRADRFDLLLLHNPDFTGYTSERVWSAMDKLRDG